MLNPNIIDMVKDEGGRYTLVVAVAKRARQIASNAEKKGEIITEKPVSLAINELQDNKLKIIYPLS